MNKLQTEEFFNYKNFAKKGHSLEIEGNNFNRISEKYIRDILTILFKKYKLKNSVEDFYESDLSSLLIAGYNAAFRTVYSLIKYKPVANQSATDILQVSFMHLNRSGLGKFQLIETNANKSIVRSYRSIEDRLYVDLNGKSDYPVSAFTAGMVMACHNFAHNSSQILQKKNLDRSNLLIQLSTVKQNRCEAEDLSFSEFNVTTKVSG